MRRRVSLLLVALSLSLIFVASVSARPSAASHAVQIKGFAFNPASITVAVGDSVTWSNNDTLPHTVTAAGAFDTGPINGGATGSVTFSTAGTFNYVCSFHSNMTGTVVVQAAAAPVATAAPGTPVSPGLPPSGAAERPSLWLFAAIAGLLLAAGLLLRRRPA